MSDIPSSTHSHDVHDHASREEVLSALFANMVVQQTNMALIFLGKVPHPETGEQVQDINAAQMFIDQLEMLEAKTKGNLDKREEGLLKQSLMTLRMAFVETVERAPATSPQKETAPATGQAPPAAGAEEQKPSTPAGASGEDAESRKKFTKKY